MSHLPNITAALNRMDNKIEKLLKQGEKLMAKVDEMLKDLQDSNVETSQIAEDVTALLAKLEAGGLTKAEADQVHAEITSLSARLKAVNAQYPVDGGTPV